MYFPIGWPKILQIPQDDRQNIKHIVCNRDRILFACVTEDSIGIWYSKPCVLVSNHRRSKDSVEEMGTNLFATWRVDSSMLAVVTSRGHILFFKVDLDKTKSKSLFVQVDSRIPSLQRESAELFIKDVIPPIILTLAFCIKVPGGITSVVIIRDELMVATETGQIERYHWDGRVDLDYCLELSHIHFLVDQQYSKAVPVEESGVHVVDMEYSPILGGFAVVLSDGRAALLTAPSLKFEPDDVKGLWAQDVVDATCTVVNHKYLLIAYGRLGGQTAICHIDEVTGGLQISHTLLLSSKDYPDSSSLGPVKCVRWTPDSCAILVAWELGGIGMWSVYGALLLCSLGWDYGISHDLMRSNPLLVETMEWGLEGYQLWISINRHSDNPHQPNHLAQMHFVKSALTVNPWMSNQGHLVLQGEDRLFINAGRAVTEVWKQRIRSSATLFDGMDENAEDGDNQKATPNSLLANKQWVVVMIPSAYSSTNWPIRYTAVDENGKNAAVAGKTGVAHCCLQTKKWKLFGNETQEKDFVVTGSLLWWQDHLVMGCYNIQDDRDEIRLYPRDSKLDNSFVRITRVPMQILLLNLHKNRLIAFCADSHIGVYSFVGAKDPHNSSVQLVKEQDIDVSNLSVHPVCVSHVILVSSRAEGSSTARGAMMESVLVNVCGRVVMFQLTVSGSSQTNGGGSRMLTPVYVNPTVVASNVESIWVSGHSSKEKKHLVESLLFGCGAQGMKVWLPLFPKDGEKPHNFMSKWIMLPISVNIYPLTVLFEDAVVLGAENDTVLYPTEPASLGITHPFSIVERTSRVYLHLILRQLLRRNLGFHAWEIARSCTSLSYFPHTLELLLHEVLEEEATSKEPIPDALLPRVVAFIREFPVYLQTIVQCARKIEIALWPYLFSTVGQPHNLFQECLQKNQLATGASYLIILQNLESSSISRQYATKLLDAALEHGEWQLCKDLVRFLKAIDPSDVESPPRSSFVPPSSAKYPAAHPAPPVSANEEISFVLGTMQVPRARTYSLATMTKADNPGPSGILKDGIQLRSDPKKIPQKRRSWSANSKDAIASPEEFFMDVILQRHARKLLSNCRLKDLGCFAAHLDFHLVSWLRKEKGRAAKVDEFVTVLRMIHNDFQWPFPVAPHPISYYMAQKDASSEPNSPDSALSFAGKVNGLGEEVDRLALSNANNDQTRGGNYENHTGLESDFCRRTFGSDQNVARIQEAQLRPHASREDESVKTLDLSEDSSLWGDGDQALLDEGSWTTLSFTSDLEQMTVELASKGPPHSEAQLRYLLQIMMEANCLEWAVLISVVLRDAMAVIRIVNAARAADVPQDVTARLKDGLAALEYWADRECLGYKRFMHTIRNQSTILSKIVWSKLRIRSPSPTLDSELDGLQAYQIPPTVNAAGCSLHHLQHNHHHHQNHQSEHQYGNSDPYELRDGSADDDDDCDHDDDVIDSDSVRVDGLSSQETCKSAKDDCEVGGGASGGVSNNVRVDSDQKREPNSERGSSKEASQGMDCVVS